MLKAEEVLKDKQKFVSRHIKALIFNINPIFVDAEYIEREKGNNFVILTLGDNTHRIVEDYNYPKVTLAHAILDELGDYT